MNTVAFNRQTVIALAILLLVCGTTVWFYNASCARSTQHSHQHLARTQDRFTVWPKFSSKLWKPHDWYRANCFGTEIKELNVAVIYDLVESWKISTDPTCQALYKKFSTIYSVNQRSGGVIIPESFAPKVKGWLGGNEELFKQVSKQTITMVYNELTNDNTIFNPIRGKRPVKKPEEPERDYVERQQAAIKNTCDFCKYKEFTSTDKLGRLENKFAFSASNTFKYDSWHSLFVTRQHHPLNWGKDDMIGMLQLASAWFEKVHSTDNQYVLPMIIWDLNPKSGASQVHPHVQGSMGTNHYYGMIERWRRAGQEYVDVAGANYFTDQLQIHNALGLAVQYGTAAAYASVTPKKDNEVVVIGEADNEDFLKLIYFLTRAYIDDMEMLCFSGAIAYPQKGSGSKLGDIPVYARFITRGAIAEIRSDISSLELFTASQVNRDPYIVISFLKKSIEKRG